MAAMGAHRCLQHHFTAHSMAVRFLAEVQLSVYGTMPCDIPYSVARLSFGSTRTTSPILSLTEDGQLLHSSEIVHMSTELVPYCSSPRCVLESFAQCNTGLCIVQLLCTATCGGMYRALLWSTLCTTVASTARTLSYCITQRSVPHYSAICRVQYCSSYHAAQWSFFQYPPLHAVQHTADSAPHGVKSYRSTLDVFSVKPSLPPPSTTAPAEKGLIPSRAFCCTGYFLSTVKPPPVTIPYGEPTLAYYYSIIFLARSDARAESRASWSFIRCCVGVVM